MLTAAFTLLLFATIGAITWNTLEHSAGEVEAVSQQDAESLLRDVANFAKAGDYDGICRSIATEPSLCRHLAQDARAQAPIDAVLPAVTGYTVDAGESGSNRVSVLHLQGRHADGTQYTSDFAVVRVKREGIVRLSSVTPIYWSGVKYSPGGACRDGSRPGRACGANTRTIAP
ncbi:hypothetical protein [Lentzea xinjiangensis]|nr:hypothetical protein [Lentzea xinjiangensis]